MLTSLLMCCPSHLPGKQFLSIYNKTTYFHMHISISEFVIPLCCRYQVVLSCTCKEYVKICNSWLLPHITVQPLIPVVYLQEHIILSCITSHNVKKTSTNHITNQYWISSSACPYLGYGQSNVYVFSLSSR